MFCPEFHTYSTPEERMLVKNKMVAVVARKVIWMCELSFVTQTL
jgi:hypothetical protein